VEKPPNRLIPPVSAVGEQYWGKPDVRFDEGVVEPGHGIAIEAPTDERVGKRIGDAYNRGIWFLLYWQGKRVL
jgi:hypothetical protein